MKLLVATGNPGKLQEFREILAPVLGSAHELVSLADLELGAPEETGLTFHENASLKASAGAAASGLWTLGDDSGLCVDVLGGEPGLRSARYADSDEARRAKLLKNVGATPESRRGAHFECALALAAPGGKRVFRVDGRLDGRIAHEARGTNGFGYDPIFVPDEVPHRTLAELPSAEKNRLSHRGRAFARIAPLLRELLENGDVLG